MSNEVNVGSRSRFLYKTYQSVFSPILIYSVIIFITGIGDAIMSYVTPVYIEHRLNSSFLLGLVISFSSVVGICCDFLFAEIFHGKRFSFFLWGTFITALLFPLTLLFFPSNVAVFLVAMALWGVYYELTSFSHFHFIHTFMKREQNATAWGIVESFRATAYFLGPLIAAVLLDQGERIPFYMSLGFFFAGMFGFILFMHAKRRSTVVHDQTVKKPSIIAELKIWRVLLGRVWHLYIFIFSLYLLDSAFWTIGTVLSENLKDQHPLGRLLLTAYVLPSLFVGLFANRASHPFGKKKAAFICACIGGLLLALTGLTSDVLVFIAFVFLSSLFLSLSFPEILATFEDYVARLGEVGNDFIGLQNSATSLAYIIGPIFAGGIAAIIGEKTSFAVIGMFLFLVALFSLLVVPRKIRMPQQELSKIYSEE